MEWPQMGPGVFLFPTNPDLADILGRTDLDFENLCFFDFLDPKFLDFQVPRFPNSQIEAWARPGRTWTCSSTPLRWLRGDSAALPDCKAREIQGTRALP